MRWSVRDRIDIKSRLRGGALLLCATASGASAASLFVFPNGSGSFCTQLSPCNLATALSKAQDGDIIFTGTGTYTGTGDAVVTVAKSIRLYGGWDGAPSGVPGRNRTMFVSTIDGQNARRGVTIDGSLTVTVDGFTILNGNASGLTTHCVGSAGPAAGCGGGVFIYQAAATVSNCIIRNNIAATGGGLPASTTAYGGGIYGWFSSGLDIKNNTITGNTAGDVGSAEGGGVAVINCSAGTKVSGNLIFANVASGSSEVGWGGGLALNSGAVAVEGNVIESNRASVGTDSQGSGLYVWYGSHSVGGNTFVGNQDDDAVYLGYFSGVFASNRVVANPAGTAVRLANQQDPQSPLLVNNVIEANGAYAVAATGSSPFPLTVELDHNTIVGDLTTTGVWANAHATLTMTDNILSRHQTSLAGEVGSVFNADHTLFWADTYDDIRGTHPLDGNPNFVNALGRDYHLRPGSAAADTGAEAGVTADIDGHGRPLGGAPDIGAYEISPSTFDFGTSTSPVATGYTRVSPASAYSTDAGFGWVSGVIGSRDRLVGGNLTRDFNFTTDGTFQTDLVNGPYDVTITFGDAAGPHDQMGVFLEDGQVDTVTTSTNQFITRTYHVAVWDGQLTLRLADLGGTDANTVIDALVVRPSNTRKLDFGTSGSPVAPAYLRVANTTTYTPALGLGWQSGTITSRDRGPATSDLRRDFNVTASGAFAVDLPDDDYNLRILTGDADRAHDAMRFGIDSPGYAFNVSTAAGQFDLLAVRIGITDGQLDLFLSDGGGADPNVVINAVDVEPRDALRFDFGTATSPVALGYRAVTPVSVYSHLAGYGWLDGAVYPRDRGVGTDVNRDFDFSHDATFAVDVPNSTYEVTITMGDATTKHDQMGVFIEGSLVDTVTTLANQFLTKTYTAAVIGGQLTLELKDLGGSDSNAVINALEIR